MIIFSKTMSTFWIVSTKVFVFFKSVHGISLGVIILNIVAYGKRTICAAFLGSENDLSTGIAKYCHSKFLTSFFRDFYKEQNPGTQETFLLK